MNEPQWPKPPTKTLPMLIHDVGTMVQVTLWLTILNVLMLAYDTDFIYHINQAVHSL